MSILKGILHHWNKTTSAYDTIHPETEAAQVTDWNQGIVNTLASTALGGLVSTLTSDSLFATLLKKALTALGVKYLAAQNGYMCFGEIVGNIIIQWGIVIQPATNNEVTRTITMPISASAIIVAVCCCETYSCQATIGPSYRTGSSFTYRQQAWTNGDVWSDWIVVCK